MPPHERPPWPLCLTLDDISQQLPQFFEGFIYQCPGENPRYTLVEAGLKAFKVQDNYALSAL